MPTHTHTRIYRHTHKRQRDISIWICLYAQKSGRVFLAARVAFLLTICIYREGEGGEEGRGEGVGEGRAKTSKDPSRRFSMEISFSRRPMSRPAVLGPTRVDRFFNRFYRRIRNNFVSAIRVLSIGLIFLCPPPD